MKDYRRFPFHLDIETTNVCNLNCPMCPRFKMTRKQGFMEWDLFQKIADEAGRDGAKQCYLHIFGEPLIHPQIIEMINYIAQKGIRTSLSTNCTTLTPELSEKILTSGLHEIILSLDAATEETYKKYRTGGNFQKITENVDTFLRLRREKPTHWFRKNIPWVQLQTIKMRENAHEIKMLKAKYDALLSGIGEVSVKGFSTFAGQVEDMNTKQTSPVRFRCTKWKHSMSIYYDGTVVVCCRDYDGISAMGNVKTQSIKEIWENEAYRHFRASLRRQDWDPLELCKTC